MASANDAAPVPSTAWLLAGLQAGVLGVLGMLAWLGMTALWQGRTFWTAANLMGTFFYGDKALRPGFGRNTLAGIALYLLIYGLLGMLFASVARGRITGLRMLLVSLLFGVLWYYFSFHLLWKKIAPLVSLLYIERPTFVGHLVFGAFLTRIPHLLPDLDLSGDEIPAADATPPPSPDPVA